MSIRTSPAHFCARFLLKNARCRCFYGLPVFHFSSFRFIHSNNMRSSDRVVLMNQSVCMQSYDCRLAQQFNRSDRFVSLWVFMCILWIFLVFIFRTMTNQSATKKNRYSICFFSSSSKKSISCSSLLCSQLQKRKLTEKMDAKFDSFTPQIAMSDDSIVFDICISHI